jgi:predicted transcriptional regulator
MRNSLGKSDSPASEQQLTRRERQIMDILYASGRATGAEILQGLSDQPSYSTVRTILRVLERKGHVRHVEENLRYVYLPTVRPDQARQSALERVVRTFFDGSAKLAAAAFLDPKAFSLSKDELNELVQMVEQARKEVK